MASRRRTAARIAGIFVIGPLIIGLLTVLVLTRTDRGREVIREFGVSQLTGRVNGHVSIGRLGGNLLTGATFADVVIEDSAGGPFLRADTLALRYSLRSLVSKALIFRDVRLVRPVVVLDQSAGGEWNVSRVFPGDTVAAPAGGNGGQGGFGSVVRFENLSVRDGTLVVRTAWAPADTLRGAARAAAIEAALSPASRSWIVPAGSGWRRLTVLNALDAHIALIRLADPDSASRVVDVDSATMLAFPFRPPAAEVRALSGRLELDADTLRLDGVDLALPATRVRGQARRSVREGALRAALAVDALSFEDLAWLRPGLPPGGGEGEFTIVQRGAAIRVVARGLDARLDGGRIGGEFDLRLGDTVRIGGADVTLDALDTRALDRLAGGEAVPLDGVISGRISLTGTPDRLEVAARTEVRDRSGGVSRITADGTIGTAADDGLDAHRLVMRFDPIQTSLVRQLEPGLRLNGTLSGSATVSGSPRTGLSVAADLVHRDARTGRSHVLANGVVGLDGAMLARNLRLRLDPLQAGALDAFAPGLGLAGAWSGTAVLNGSPGTRLQARLDVTHTAPTGTSRVEGAAVLRGGGGFALDLSLPTLSLATVGTWFPAAALRGSASGTLRVDGTRGQTAFTADLTLPDSGHIAAGGTVGRTRSTRAYDVRADLDRVNAAAASARAPGTRLSGHVEARGTGTDPATMRATFEADLVDTHIAGTELDTSHVRVAVAEGVARIDRAELRIASARAELEGTFGLVDGRTGEVSYCVTVDRLADFRGYIPGDTGVVLPRPAVQARRVATARSDSARVAEATEVQRAATGQPAAPVLDVDSVRPLQRDSVAGRLAFSGTLMGNLGRFDVRGSAQADHVVASGAALAHGRASYALRGLRTPDADADIDTRMDSLHAGGFAFDSAAARLRYRGVRDRGTGAVDLAVFQDAGRGYRLGSEFLLDAGRREVTVNEFVLRFDTVQWMAPHRGRLSWAGSGLLLDSLEVRRVGDSGRIAIDGRIAKDAPSNVRLSVRDLPLGQLAALLQDTVSRAGLLTMDAQLQGTSADPRMEGTIALRDGSLAGRRLPDAHAVFDYAGRELRAEAELLDRDRSLLSARARLPIDLGFTGVKGGRLLDGPLGIEAHADSLPLEVLPGLSGTVSDLRGRLHGNVVVGGTWNAPVLEGGVFLDLASLRIVPAGVWLRDIAGAVQMAGDAVTIDSLVAHSGGPIRVSGRMDVERLTRPTLSLRVAAHDALLFDTDRGTVRADANLTVAGPLYGALIQGDARIREGVFYVPDMGESRRVAPLDNASVLALPDAARFDAAVLPRANPLLDRLRLDLGVRIDRNTWVRSSDMNVEVYTPRDVGPLWLRMNTDRPGLALEGSINADRGEYEFAGRVFDLTTGAVTFLPGEGADPLLQLTANYEVPRRGRETLVIQIHLTGSLRRPRIALESTAEPPLSQSDLLSYLAFGQASSTVLTLDDAGLTGGGDGTGGIGALAQQQLASLALGTAVDDAVASLERKGGRTLDVFRIHPASLPDELVFAGGLDNFLRGTEVEAGKYVTGGLFVAADGRTTTEAWPGLRVEYETATGFSWRLSWTPRYLPGQPTFATHPPARTTRVLGTFFSWARRF